MRDNHHTALDQIRHCGIIDPSSDQIGIDEACQADDLLRQGLAGILGPAACAANPDDAAAHLEIDRAGGKLDDPAGACVERRGLRVDDERLPDLAFGLGQVEPSGEGRARSLVMRSLRSS